MRQCRHTLVRSLAEGEADLAVVHALVALVFQRVVIEQEESADTEQTVVDLKVVLEESDEVRQILADLVEHLAEL